MKHCLSCLIDYFTNLKIDIFKYRCRTISLPWQAAKQNILEKKKVFPLEKSSNPTGLV